MTAHKNGKTNALLLDALANTAIEQVCDKAEQQIQETMPNRFFTWRFSPGYGDFPISSQPKLLAQLNAARQVGITTTETHLMTPRKPLPPFSAVLSVRYQNGGRDAVSVRCGKPVVTERKEPTAVEQNPIFKKKLRLYLDGGHGHNASRKSGMPAGEIPEKYNIEHPEQITNIHKAFLEAGADIIYANTFGANRLK